MQPIASPWLSPKVVTEKILPIVTGNSEISLRVLDYFVTNYSKYNDVKIKKKNNINYNVYQDYKNKLKSYNKRFFDPFCRINKKICGCIRIKRQ